MVGHACITVYYLLENRNHSIFQIPIPPCLAGSRAWSKSFVNAGYGQKKGYRLSAQNSNAHQTALTAAAGARSSLNPTSQINVRSSKSSSRGTVICAIFTLNTIANSILSNNTGAWPRLDTVWPPERRLSEKWRPLSRSALTTFLFNRFVGQFFSFSFFFHSFCISSVVVPLRFADRSARFVAAYREGLSGAQAAWANKTYHGHRTLPPQAILDAKGAIGE